MNDKKLILHRCCFTGHRPEKLPYSEEVIKQLLDKAVNEAIAAGYLTFITGMAMGTDILAAEIVIEKKKHNNELHLICAIPHSGFEKCRNKYEEERYNNIINNADYVRVISKKYFKACYQRRNEFTVDHSNLVIAVCTGVKSGTKNCIDYAKSRGVKIINILEDY